MEQAATNRGGGPLLARARVRAETSRGVVVGYEVFDTVGGMESRHAFYPVDAHGDRKARALAETFRDGWNDELEANPQAARRSASR